MRGGNQLPSPEGAAARSPQEHEQGTERGWERSRPTQLLEPWEHVHHEEAVVRLALHHGVQPQVHVQEPRQGVEPEDLRQRGDAVVVEVEALQRRQALNALPGQTHGETGVDTHSLHTASENGKLAYCIFLPQKSFGVYAAPCSQSTLAAQLHFTGT